MRFKQQHNPFSPQFGGMENQGNVREGDIFDRPKWEDRLGRPAGLKGAVQDLDVHRTLKRFKEGAYISYEEAFAFIKKAYPLNPYDPAKPFARELRLKVGERLGLTREEELHRLKLYSTIGSPLDRIHGVDALIIYDDPEMGEIIVTIDETENPKKFDEDDGKQKVDILMHGIAADPKEETKFNVSVSEWAKVVADVLSNKIRDEEKSGRRLH